jgi:hypothetical protein
VHREIKNNLAAASVSKLSEARGVVAGSVSSSSRIRVAPSAAASKAPWPQCGTHKIGDRATSFGGPSFRTDTESQDLEWLSMNAVSRFADFSAPTMMEAKRSVAAQASRL